MEGTQILTLTALGAILLIALFILSRVLKLTQTFICIVIFAPAAIVFVALWAMGG